MLRRFVLTACAVVFCLGTLVGCSNDGGADNSGTGGTLTTAKSKKQLPLHVSGEKHTPAVKAKKKADKAAAGDKAPAAAPAAAKN